MTYPNPNGDGVIQSDGRDAPPGMIRWIDDEPFAVRDDVTVRAHPVEHPASLINALGVLPGLRFGESALYMPPREEEPTFTPAEWR